jgi:hypothetical protein
MVSTEEYVNPGKIRLTTALNCPIGTVTNYFVPFNYVF